MAEALVSVVLEQLALITNQEIQQEVSLVVGVETEVQKLTSNLQTIGAVLVDAEKRQVSEEVVKDWLEKLKDVSYDMDDVLDEWSTAILKKQIEGVENALVPKKTVCSYIPSPCFCFSRVVMRRDIALKIKELNARLDVIASEKDGYHFKSITNAEEPERQKTISFVDVSEVYGRGEDKKTIVSKLLCESSQEERSLHIISIVGMGGIGKTTLAQLAYNDPKVNSHFDKTIWVCVSDPLDMIRIAKAIVEALKNNAPNLSELETLLQRVRESISGKKFLLVLDDVWTGDYEKWKPLIHSLKCGSQESKILVTTRNEKVAMTMGSTSTNMFHLGKLFEEESWSLFSQRAFFGRGGEEQENLKEIGRKIADKCKGLPLAIKTLGSLMCFKKTKQQWQNVLDSEIWEFEEVEEGLLPPLLLSYYDLPSALKRCFSYCAIFPKDYKIMKDELIRLWMAQGYLSSERSTEMEITGQEYFENLVMRSFFQDFGRNREDGSIYSCKMHDIVHDFAQFLTKNECFFMEVDGEKEPSTDSSYKKGRHLTIILGDQAPFPVSIYDDAQNLRTLLFPGNYNFTTGIGNAQVVNLFHHLKCLRALDLSENKLKELPGEVRNLMHLKYLNLSENDFVELPETVCNLCNLQILDLDGCFKLEKLPKGMENLINLRQLFIEATPLKFLPKGIGRLSSLRTLTDFIVSDGDEREECKLGDLEKLNNLQGSLTISSLGNVVDPDEAKKANLKSKKHLLRLYLGFYSNGPEVRMGRIDDVIESLEPHPNLEFLNINSYRCLSFPNWMMLLPNLRRLELSHCVSLSSLWKMPSLESLEIWGTHSLKKVGGEFVGLGVDNDDGRIEASGIIAFPKLKRLHFHMMREWEVWDAWNEWDVIITRSRIEEEKITIMPCLRSLTIQQCPKLKALPQYLQTMQIEKLEIGECPILKQRCRKGIGEEWAKISHIPNIRIEDGPF